MPNQSAPAPGPSEAANTNQPLSRQNGGSSQRDPGLPEFENTTKHTETDPAKLNMNVISMPSARVSDMQELPHVGQSHIRRISIVYLKFKCNFSLVTHTSFYPFVWFMQFPKLPLHMAANTPGCGGSGAGGGTKGRYQRAGPALPLHR